MTFPYNLNIPAAGNTPANDQPLIQQNFASIGGWVKVDHVAFETNPGAGTHEQITFNANQSAPGFGSGVSDLFVNLSGSPALSQLFFQNSAGTVSLTGSIISNSGSISPNGSYTVFQTPWGLKLFTGNYNRAGGTSNYSLSGTTFGSTVYTSLVSPTGQTDTSSTASGAFGMRANAGANTLTTYFAGSTTIFLNFLVITS
jgi:hypothetical protein